MAYQTGTPTSQIDLVQQLNTFLTANGWTSDASASEGSGWAVHVHKGSVYSHIRACVGEGLWLGGQGDSGGSGVLLYLSDGYSGSQLWNNQPTNPPFGNGTSNPVGVGMELEPGPYSNYYFFSDTTNDNIVVVLEKTPGLYEFIGWGTSLKKNGSWTGGPYFFGSASGYYATYRSAGADAGFGTTSNCPGSYDDSIGNAAAAFVRCDVDTFTGKWIPISDVSFASGGYTGRNGASSVYGSSSPPSSIPAYARGAYNPTASPRYFQWMQTSVLDGRVNLLPILWWAERDGGSGASGGYSLIGSLPTVFFSNGVGSGFVPAADYTIGPDTYKMFPNFAVLKNP